MVPVRELIDRALRTIGVFRAGDALSEPTLAECPLRILNQILAATSSATGEMRLELSPGCQQYVLDEDVVSILAVEAVVPVAGGELTVDLRNEPFEHIFSRPPVSSDLPTLYAEGGGYPLCLAVWPIPQRRFQVIVTVATANRVRAEIDDMLDAPPVVLEALTMNFACQLAAPLGVQPDPRLLQEAQQIGRMRFAWSEIRIIQAQVNVELANLLQAKAVLLRQLEKLKKAA